MIKYLTQSLKKTTSINIEEQFQAAERMHTLQKLLDNKARILIRIDNNKQVYQSMILSIDSLNKTLLIDELFPTPEIDLSLQQFIHCEHHDAGSTTSFTIRVFASTHSSGFPALITHLPETIEQEQRRNYFRLKTPSQQSMSVSLSSSSNANLSGYVKDLSNHGFRINILGNYNDDLNQGDTLSYCRIQLTKTSQIECQLLIRSKRYIDTPYRHTQLGTEIIALRQSHQNLLSQYLNKQQRAQCRQRAEYS